MEIDVDLWIAMGATSDRGKLDMGYVPPGPFIKYRPNPIKEANAILREEEMGSLTTRKLNEINHRKLRSTLGSRTNRRTGTKGRWARKPRVKVLMKRLVKEAVEKLGLLKVSE